ncbi:MAG: hypothetical protein ACM3XQ_07745 [Nocardioidaceae bacterium]
MVSDLQCPARFLLLTDPDVSMAATLSHERAAAVYDGGGGPGAQALAEALGVPAQALAQPLTIAGVLARDAEALRVLEDLADLHRGETVVVTAQGGPGRRVDVAVDADGHTVEEVSPGDAR